MGHKVRRLLIILGGLITSAAVFTGTAGPAAAGLNLSNHTEPLLRHHSG